MDIVLAAAAFLMWVVIAVIALAALVAVGFAVVPPLTRALYTRWGATAEEAAETLPGDGFVKEPQQEMTQGITIDAPPELLNQLVRQQGYKRAGWHGWDWFYAATGSADFVDGHFSARVVPELQGITVGDDVYINSMVVYKVAIDEKPGVFALYAGGDAEGRPLEASESARAVKASTSWVWVMRPTDDGGTRLVLRIRADMRGQGPFLAWLFDNPLDFGGALFANKTLRGIKRTAEALASAR